MGEAFCEQTVALQVNFLHRRVPSGPSEIAGKSWEIQQRLMQSDACYFFLEALAALQLGSVHLNLPLAPVYCPAVTPASERPLVQNLSSRTLLRNQTCPAAFFVVAMRDIPLLNKISISAGAFGTPEPSVPYRPVVQEIHFQRNEGTIFL